MAEEPKNQDLRAEVHEEENQNPIKLVKDAIKNALETKEVDGLVAALEALNKALTQDERSLRDPKYRHEGDLEEDLSEFIIEVNQRLAEGEQMSTAYNLYLTDRDVRVLLKVGPLNPGGVAVELTDDSPDYIEEAWKDLKANLK